MADGFEERRRVRRKLCFWGKVGNSGGVGSGIDVRDIFKGDGDVGGSVSWDDAKVDIRTAARKYIENVDRKDVGSVVGEDTRNDVRVINVVGKDTIIVTVVRNVAGDIFFVTFSDDFSSSVSTMIFSNFFETNFNEW